MGLHRPTLIVFGTGFKYFAVIELRTVCIKLKWQWIAFRLIARPQKPKFHSDKLVQNLLETMFSTRSPQVRDHVSDKLDLMEFDLNVAIGPSYERRRAATSKKRASCQ